MTFCSNSSYQIRTAGPRKALSVQDKLAEFICYGKQKTASLYVQRLLYSGRFGIWVRDLAFRGSFLIWLLFEGLRKINNDNREQKANITIGHD